MEEHLFRWDEGSWEKVTEKNKKQIIEFVVHNYDPKLSLKVKIENIELACHIPYFAIYLSIARAYFLYCNPRLTLSPGNDSANKLVWLCSYFYPGGPVLSTGCAQTSVYSYTVFIKADEE